MCLDCDQRQVWRCDTYGCGPCGETKRRRLIRVIETGTDRHLATGGLFAYFLTLTAPGENDHARWVQGSQHRTADGGRRPRSAAGARVACECHRHGRTLAGWNAGESACWNRLRTSIARDQRLIYIGSVEPQDRGCLHRHLVVFSDQPLDFDRVQALALAAGYGCVMDLQRLESSTTVARYLSKYVSKGATARSTVPWVAAEVVDVETGEITEHTGRATYRLWSSSQTWGVTMRQIKAVASSQARARARYLHELAEALAAAEGSSRPAAGLAPALVSATGPP